MRTYLRAMALDGKTQFWNDSAEPEEIGRALDTGAVGVTTNPVLVTRTVLAHRDEWAAQVRDLARTVGVERLPHEVTARVVATAADLVRPLFERSLGGLGLVCAQVNPFDHGDAELMMAEALQFHALRPNIAVKIPVTAAGLVCIEELAARGVTVTATTSFSVPQVCQVAEAHRRGLARRQDSSGRAPLSFAVIMAGRLDDFLREVVKAGGLDVPDEVITQAGVSVTKKAYQIFHERGYASRLLIGGMRGPYHVTRLAGGDMVLTVAPAMQDQMLPPDVFYQRTIEQPVDQQVIDTLLTLPDFRRAHDANGMKAEAFAAFGPNVRTQGQFMDSYKALQDFITQALG